MRQVAQASSLPVSLLEELMLELEAKSKTEAVVKAIKDEIRIIF